MSHHAQLAPVWTDEFLLNRLAVSEITGGHRRNSRAPKAPVAADPNREKRVDRADIPKFGKIEVNKD